LPYVQPYIQRGQLLVTDAKALFLQVWKIRLPRRYFEWIDVAEQEKTITALREQLIAARAEIQHARVLQHENAELRKLLALHAPQGFKVVGAQVLCQTNTYTHVLLLDAGTDRSICLNAAVVVSEGLVGRVVQVGKTWSRVLLITDGSSRIPASFYPSRSNVILSGNFSSHLSVDLMSDRQLDAAQMAFTSGVGTIFPKGLFVGSLEATDSMRVTTAAPMRQLTFVCVLVPIASRDTLHESP
jgi:rod shape-determining protein MreC